MHGLVLETSICYWQDQPGNSRGGWVMTNQTVGRHQERREEEASLHPWVAFSCFFCRWSYLVVVDSLIQSFSHSVIQSFNIGLID